MTKEKTKGKKDLKNLKKKVSYQIQKKNKKFCSNIILIKYNLFQDLTNRLR